MEWSSWVAWWAKVVAVVVVDVVAVAVVVVVACAVVVVAACGVLLRCWDFELYIWMTVGAARKCQVGVWLARHMR